MCAGTKLDYASTVLNDTAWRLAGSSSLVHCRASSFSEKLLYVKSSELTLNFPDPVRTE
jgi:hypothetical protein